MPVLIFAQTVPTCFTHPGSYGYHGYIEEYSRLQIKQVSAMSGLSNYFQNLFFNEMVILLLAAIC